jgi:galactitol PTS system EIIC component
MSVNDVIQYILGFGASVFIPVIIFILGLVVRLKVSAAFRSAVLMGVAFTGMMLVIVSLFYAQVAPAATAMVTRFGLSLDILDIGWTPAAAIAWAWPVAASMFAVQIVINLIMLALNWTKTLNVDMWNVWQKAFAGAIVVAITGSYPIAFAVAAIWIIAELKFGDWSAYMVQEYVGVPGISIPHSASLVLMIAGPLDDLISRIPGLKTVNADPRGLREKFGIFGESMIIGLIIGILLGLLAGYNLQQILTLGIAAATALMLLPMMARLFMEALAPISEAAGEFMKSRFPGREVLIGLDWPILAGNPATYAVGILCIPLLILFSVILPGNHTLIFGAIADWAWMVSVIGVITGGNIIRMIIISLFAIPAYFYTATYFGQSITTVAQAAKFALPENAQAITWFGTTPFFLFVMKILEMNWMSILWAVALVGLVFWAWKYLSKINNAAKARLDAAN